MGVTWQINGIAVAQLFRRDKKFLVGYRREEGHHVEQPVMANWCQLLRPSTVGRAKSFHPLIKNCISKGMKDLEIQTTQTLNSHYYNCSDVIKEVTSSPLK